MSTTVGTSIEPAVMLATPSDGEVDAALSRFAADVRRHYGARLKGLYLFGSRARGNHRLASDADVAVVLADDGWEFWKEKRQLIHLAYGHTIELGVHIQPWPFGEGLWQGKRDGRFAKVATNARRDAQALESTP